MPHVGSQPSDASSCSPPICPPARWTNLGTEDDFDRVALAFSHDTKRLRDSLQGELMGHQLGPMQASLSGQRHCAFDVIAPFSARREDRDITAYHRTQIQGHRLRVKRDDEDLATTF